MGNIDKDQFERYLEENNPVEEPSPAVFQRLQKEAVWNQRPSSSKKVILGTVAVLIIGLLLLLVSFLREVNQPDMQKLEKIQIPVLEKMIPETRDVVAFNEIHSEKGSYRFMSYKSDDFNLFFRDDTSGQTILSISRELDSI